MVAFSVRHMKYDFFFARILEALIAAECCNMHVVRKNLQINSGVVCSGSLYELNQFVHRVKWSTELIPNETLHNVEKFMKFLPH